MRRHIAFAALLIVAVACNRSAETPTGPGNAARLSFIVSTTSSHTIRKANLVFDGRVVATAEVAGGGGQVTLDATVNAAQGSHRIAIVIVDQASSPNPYFAGGAITTPMKIVDLAPLQRVLATGESLEFVADF